MIYLIGGVPGMRKSTIISSLFLAQKPIGYISTDHIRAHMKDLFVKVGGDPQKAEITELPDIRKHDDAIGWVGVITLMQLLNRQQKDALIEGIDISPTGIRNLERQDENFKVRAAFVGYSKIMEFHPPEWTLELERLIGTSAGKDFLEYCKKRDWIYKDEHEKPCMRPYDEFEEARRIKDAVDTIRKSDCENFEYFDLIDYIPSERRDGDIARLQLEDHVKIAVRIISFLLGQS